MKSRIKENGNFYGFAQITEKYQVWDAGFQEQFDFQKQQFFSKHTVRTGFWLQ